MKVSKFQKGVLTAIGFIIAVVIPSATLVAFRDIGHINIGIAMFFILLIATFTAYKIIILDRWWNKE